MYGALVVTLAMILRLINCRFIIIIIIIIIINSIFWRKLRRYALYSLGLRVVVGSGVVVNGKHAYC